MLFVEFLALVGISGAAIFGLVTFSTRMAQRNRRLKEAMDRAAQALKDEDPTKIEDALFLYGDVLTKRVQEHLRARQADMIISLTYNGLDPRVKEKK